jgi:hypothetical protein
VDSPTKTEIKKKKPDHPPESRFVIKISCEVCRNAGVSDSSTHCADVVMIEKLHEHCIRVDGIVIMSANLPSLATAKERYPPITST